MSILPHCPLHPPQAQSAGDSSNLETSSPAKPPAPVAGDTGVRVPVRPSPVRGMLGGGREMTVLCQQPLDGATRPGTSCSAASHRARSFQQHLPGWGHPLPPGPVPVAVLPVDKSKEQHGRERRQLFSTLCPSLPALPRVRGRPWPKHTWAEEQATAVVSFLLPS